MWRGVFLLFVWFFLVGVLEKVVGVVCVGVDGVWVENQ